MKWNPEKQCFTNDDGTLLKPTRSLAERFPLDQRCNRTVNHTRESDRQCRECIVEAKAGERWRIYLRKELACVYK